MVSPQSGSLARIRQTLAHDNFRIYLYGSSISLIGTWMQRVAVGWLVWELTQSGFWLGFVAFCDLFPAVLLGPFCGVLADRYDRKTLLTICSVAALVQALLLFAFTAGGVMTIGYLAALALVGGCINGMYHPTRLSIMPSLLPRESLPNAIALNSVLFNFARFLGPALAGVLIVSVGIGGAFAVNALTYLAFLFALSQLNLPTRPNNESADGVKTSFAKQLGDGIVYTLRHSKIAPLLVLLLAVSLTLRPFVDMMPAFAAITFQGGAGALAILSASIGIGAMIAGVLMAGRQIDKLVPLILAATLGLAVSIIGFLSVDQVWLGSIFLAFAGAAMVSSGISMQILLQLLVSDAMRGRVLSLYSIVFFGGPAAGALLMGSLSERFGFRLPFLFGAAATSIVVALLWLRTSMNANEETDGQV